MKRWRRVGWQVIVRAGVALPLVTLATLCVRSQTGSNERVFPQSKDAIEKTLAGMQASLAGRLPVLDGFATAQHPLDCYQRGYYQASVQVSATSAGSLVRISAKVTAWYSDPVATRSGYQLLTSNGRLEADLLDQLAEQLAKGSPQDKKSDVVATAKPADAPPASRTPAISAPGIPSPTFSSSLSQSLAAQERAMARAPQPSQPADPNKELQAEAESLQETLKNQGHPKNLVAVKKPGTPVVATPSLSAKPLFLASMHDEFEMLDFNENWVHVRVSGLSRGWIWRNSLEMPEGIPDTAHSGPSPPPAADLYHVIREESAPFPGDWQPLRGKSVKIISVQKVDDSAKDRGPQDKLEYAKYLLNKSYTEMAKKPQAMEGIVLIFDSADGGMIAATLATLQQWKSGTLSDSALWHNCFFDPPETFSSQASPGTQ